MTTSSADAVAANLQKLMSDRGEKQAALARRAGVSQRTVSNLLNPIPGRSPRLESVEAVARAYNLEGWQLLIPHQDIETLRSRSVVTVVYDYVQSDREGRRFIEHVSEKEAHYRLTDQTGGLENNKAGNDS